MFYSGFIKKKKHGQIFETFFQKELHSQEAQGVGTFKEI